MKFVDIAEIQVTAGDGGAGMVHFLREKYVPFGGPDGGNGGDGGDVYFEATRDLSTLLDFRYKRHYEAEPGGKGGTNNRTGRRGEELVLKVPCGTVVFDLDQDDLLGEVLEHGDRLRVAAGGKGGVGNSVFASSRNQAPLKSIPPSPGERKTLRLELKMLADVAIIGAPNAGKSTLVSVVSAARPKVADYPFTTLVPSLGVVSHKDSTPFVVADVPGLIAGAHLGKGLGHAFLRHIERTKVLVHLVDASTGSAETMIAEYEGILAELKLYNPELMQRPRLTVLSKLDALELEEGLTVDAVPNVAAFQKYLSEKGIESFFISSAHRRGIDELLDALTRELARFRADDARVNLTRS